MKITERKEVTHVTVDEVIVGRKCDTMVLLRNHITVNE